MKPLRVIVVDDEPLARTRIKRMLENIGSVEVVGECSNGREATEQIPKIQPDVLLLDIQMPEMDGFEVLKSLDSNYPYVIFVTAYDQYALRAFEVFALDYLLKPFNEARLEKAISRAREQIELKNGANFTDQISKLVNELKEKNHLDRLVMKDERKIWFVPVQTIDWIEAEGKYVNVHVGRDSHLLRESLTALENKLNPKLFARIHRSSIVNVERIKELQPWFHGDYRVILNDGTELILSRTYRKRFQELIGDA
jgi:two-component system, LytTR family, response regulator